VIDIYADSGPDAKSAEFRKPFVSDRYTQVIISGAQHDYRGYDDQVAKAVIDWLKHQESINKASAAPTLHRTRQRAARL